MCCPGVTEPPNTVFEAVEDAYLAIDRAGCTPVAIAIECNSLDQVLVAMLHYKLKLGPLLHYGRLTQWWGHFGL